MDDPAIGKGHADAVGIVHAHKVGPCDRANSGVEAGVPCAPITCPEPVKQGVAARRRKIRKPVAMCGPRRECCDQVGQTAGPRGDDPG